MKPLFTFLCICFCFAATAQDSDLFNTTWYLQKMVVNGTDHFPPSNSEVQYVDLHFYDTGNNTYNFGTSVCNSGGADIVFDNAQSSFNFSLFAVSLEVCQMSVNNTFEQLYFFDFFDSHENDPFVYAIVAENDGSKTLTVTNIMGDQAIYNNVFLSANEFQIQELAIYPNPVENILYVRDNSLIERIEIYNMLGDKVLSFGKNVSIYKVSNIQDGVYFVKINTVQGVVVKKIIKQ